MKQTEMTTAQVAARMGVTVHAVRWWCRNGLLPKAREVQESRGSVWMIPESALDGFVPPKKTGRPPKLKAETTKPARKRKVA